MVKCRSAAGRGFAAGVLLSKPHFISLMPKSFDLNGGAKGKGALRPPINLTQYNVNVINHKCNLSS
jgi:hypothetical protein